MDVLIKALMNWYVLLEALIPIAAICDIPTNVLIKTLIGWHVLNKALIATTTHVADCDIDAQAVCAVN